MSELLDPHRRTLALACGLVVAGAVGIMIGWVGAAAALDIPTQVAFAVSGGMGGFALVGSGLALLQIQRRRYDAAKARSDLGRIASEMGEIAEMLVQRRLPTASVQTSTHAPVRRRRVLKARRGGGAGT